MKFVYQDLEVNYTIYGKYIKGKEAILFLHGWEGSIKSFEYFAKETSVNFFCVLIDLPPFGQSSMLNKPLKVSDYMCLVLSLLENLKIEKVNIVAHSFGGRVALEFFSNNKRKSLIINKMLLTGCAGLRKFNFKRFIKIRYYKFLKILTKFNFYKSKNLLKYGSQDYVKLNPIMKETFNNIINYNQTYLLKRVNCPVLLFWGQNDKETPFCFTKTFKKHIKDCEVVATNGGHFAYLEDMNLFLKVMFAFF